MNSEVLISEVGPRDGLQNVSSIMTTAAKLEWIEAEFHCGVREIEVGSFVPPKLLPQLADTAEVVRRAVELEGLVVAALVPNLRGAADALAAGAHKITLPFSVSETHSLRNLRRSHEQVIAEVHAVRELIDRSGATVQFETSLSTAFGCTLEGAISVDKVARSAQALIAAGADEVGLSDTTGYADPQAVRERIRAVWDAVGAERLTGVHLHNTRGLGLANALAAYDCGIRTFDSSLGGLGGCPSSPGASGNIVTEDLVFMFEAMGVSTGVDVEALLDVRDIVRRNLPDEPLFGFTPDAGLPLGFAPTVATSEDRRL
ncbi:MAG: hydroxymethylglutaryl-CoA lyase [Gammaproteobacteria bacterium]